MSDATMDQAYGQRSRGGLQINWTACATIIALFTWTISGVWFAATQASSLTTAQAAIVQLQTSAKETTLQMQADEKDNEKQRVEILVHLSNMDQTLKDILNYGMPRNAQIMVPAQAPAGNTIINTAPAPSERQNLPIPTDGKCCQ
jgi:hypothetical protein